MIQSIPTNASCESPSFFHPPTNTFPENTSSTVVHSVHIFPNARNLVLNSCNFVAAPGGTINMPAQPHSECNTTKLDSDGECSDSKGETSVGPKSIPVNLNGTEDQNQNMSTRTTLDLIRDLIEIQTERKKRAMQELIRANEDIEDADLRIAGYRALEAELLRRSSE